MRNLTHAALHRVMLDEVPGHRGSRAAYNSFRVEYLGRYAAAIEPYGKGAPREAVAQVLSSAVEGVIHNAARSGELESPELKRELVALICAYLSQAGRKLA